MTEGDDGGQGQLRGSAEQFLYGVLRVYGHGGQDAAEPFGVRRHDEAGKGFDAGAPADPLIKKKLIWNTLISAVILAFIYWLVEAGVIDWYGMFEDALT